MITKETIEIAYSFLHQKRNVYIHSSLDWQKDDIEYAIASYVDEMSDELLRTISDAKAVDMEQKQWYRDNQWPKDLQAAYDLGKRLVEKAKE